MPIYPDRQGLHSTIHLISGRRFRFKLNDYKIRYIRPVGHIRRRFISLVAYHHAGIDGHAYGFVPGYKILSIILIEDNRLRIGIQADSTHSRLRSIDPGT